MSIRHKLLLALVLLAAWASAIVLAAAEIPFLSPLAGLIAAAGVVGLLVWLSFRVVRRLLWRVGRRLAFSYFLIGVLPIPMVLVLAGLGLYLLAGFFLSHLYRDGVRNLETELQAVADAALAGVPTPPPGMAIAVYRGGKRIAGDELAPTSWPDWIDGLGDPEPHGQHAADALPIAALADGRPTVVAGARDDEHAALAFLTADLTEELVRRTRLWVELTRPGDPTEPKSVQVQVFGRTLELTASSEKTPAGAREQFFSRQLPQGKDGEPPPWIDRPLLYWVELHAPLRALSTGETVAEALTATLNATPRGVARRLYSGAAEVDTAAWAALFGISVLLAEIYLAAVAMAVFMIFSLSRAVNRLSRATEAVQEGDFSFRMPAKRKDQLGDLQRSFNRMAENLESLVATAAQKEALETELSLAREVQQSLLPTAHGAADADRIGGTQSLHAHEGRDLGLFSQRVTFATHFAPSAAIGGDYYDILHLPDPARPEAEGTVAVMIADVSGHGLSAGLRMAMLKSALTILIEDGHAPEATFTRLDGLVRQRGDNRGFVTATLGLLDLERGALELINAAHPPTYLVRRGEVREIVLPSRPLGGASRRGQFARERLDLVADDIVVWVSDGLVEATNGRDEPFGYERFALTLSGAPASATTTRDRILRAVTDWRGSREIADDQTLVVMRWVGDAAG